MSDTIELVEVADADDVGALTTTSGDSGVTFTSAAITVGVQAAAGAGVGALVAHMSGGKTAKGAMVGAAASGVLGLIAVFAAGMK